MSAGLGSGTELFDRAVRRAGKAAALHYFDRTDTYDQLNDQANALAAYLVANGFRPGDRLAAFMQNTPQFVVSLIATWKAGGIFVPVNPMNRAGELGHIFTDAEPAALVIETGLYEPVYLKVDPAIPRPRIILTASPTEGISDPDTRLFGALSAHGIEGVSSLEAACEAFSGKAPVAVPSPDGIAMLVYTSGTTGKPKGAIITHRGVALGARLGQINMRHADGDTMLAIAPMFHITGLVMNLFTGFHAAGAQILTYRFHPAVVVDAIKTHRPQTTVGAITAFIALMNEPSATREALSSLKMVGCGGAPMAAAAMDAFKAQFGLTLFNGYGMTETSGVAVMVPDGTEQRADADTGALSVGRAVEGCELTIVGDDDAPLAAGAVGEVIIGSGTVSPGYWRLPEATALSRHTLGLRTGDVGKLDADGWLYLVDRKKDVVISGGYKVWPREVEDVLYAHPAVREAAVVGRPDAYRGEEVCAFISLKSGADVEGDEIVAFCRERLSAYKVPRHVEIRNDLPKTPSGKVLRRELREA